MNDVKKPTSSDIFGSAKPVDTQVSDASHLILKFIE